MNFKRLKEKSLKIIISHKNDPTQSLTKEQMTLIYDKVQDELHSYRQTNCGSIYKFNSEPVFSNGQITLDCANKDTIFWLKATLNRTLPHLDVVVGEKLYKYRLQLPYLSNDDGKGRPAEEVETEEREKILRMLENFNHISTKSWVITSVEKSRGLNKMTYYLNVGEKTHEWARRNKNLIDLGVAGKIPFREVVEPNFSVMLFIFCFMAYIAYVFFRS